MNFLEGKQKNPKGDILQYVHMINLLNSYKELRAVHGCCWLRHLIRALKKLKLWDWIQGCPSLKQVLKRKKEEKSLSCHLNGWPPVKWSLAQHWEIRNPACCYSSKKEKKSKSDSPQQKIMLAAFINAKKNLANTFQWQKCVFFEIVSARCKHVICTAYM